MTYIMIYTTCVDEDEAGRIAKSLVEKRFVACANIFPPHRAVYRWEGKVESDREVAMILKTREDLFEETREEINRLHSYETPAVLALPVIQGEKAFLQFIEDETDELKRP